MSEREFYWFCKALHWSTMCIGLLLLLILISTPLALIYGSIGLHREGYAIAMLVILFCISYRNKNLFYQRLEASLGYYGTAGIMHPLWRNVVFWTTLFIAELAMSAAILYALIKSIIAI